MQSQKLFDVGNSLAVQWSGLGAFTAKGLGSIPDPGIKIHKTRGKATRAMWPRHEAKEEEVGLLSVLAEQLPPFH